MRLALQPYCRPRGGALGIACCQRSDAYTPQQTRMVRTNFIRTSYEAHPFGPIRPSSEPHPNRPSEPLVRMGGSDGPSSEPHPNPIRTNHPNPIRTPSEPHQANGTVRARNDTKRPKSETVRVRNGRVRNGPSPKRPSPKRSETSNFSRDCFVTISEKKIRPPPL